MDINYAHFNDWLNENPNEWTYTELANKISIQPSQSLPFTISHLHFHLISQTHAYYQRPKTSSFGRVVAQAYFTWTADNQLDLCNLTWLFFFAQHYSGDFQTIRRLYFILVLLPSSHNNAQQLIFVWKISNQTCVYAIYLIVCVQCT